MTPYACVLEYQQVLTTKYFATVEFGHTTEHIVHFVSSCQYISICGGLINC